MVDVLAAAQKWARTWERAWPQRAVDDIAALYRPDAVYRSSAVRQPEPPGRRPISEASAGRASITVVRAGALSTVQDGGRRGTAHLGVPRAGALDAPAAGLANRLVGNGQEDAVLEASVDVDREGGAGVEA